VYARTAAVRVHEVKKGLLKGPGPRGICRLSIAVETITPKANAFGRTLNDAFVDSTLPQALLQERSAMLSLGVDTLEQSVCLDGDDLERNVRFYW